MISPEIWKLHQSYQGEMMEVPCETSELPWVSGSLMMYVDASQHLLRMDRTFPNWAENTQKITQVLLSDNIPRFGLPNLGDPAFVAKMVQGLTQMLKIKWKLHTAYQPQSPGNLEHMNWIQMVRKCYQQNYWRWDQVLPIVLLQAQCTFTKQMGVFPLYNPIWLDTSNHRSN